jgi:alkanesulfonate monooxygenase SsuD/methylene tetrahydromethanopterin reductase-like flavin-dependent oxidoreductase (luciferase family)
MLDLAARVGDGASLSAGASREYLRLSIASLEDSLSRYDRDRDQFRISAVVSTVVADDIAAARRDLAISGLLRFRMPELQVGVDLPDDAQVSATLEQDGPEAAAELFSDDVIDEFGIAATPHTLGAALEEYGAIGIDELIVMLTGDTAGHPSVVKQLALAK